MFKAFPHFQISSLLHSDWVSRKLIHKYAMQWILLVSNHFVLITRSALTPKVRARERSLSLQITWKNGSCQLIQYVLPFFSKLERQISFPHPSPRSSLVREISRWFSSMRKKSQLQSSVTATFSEEGDECGRLQLATVSHGFPNDLCPLRSESV